MKKLANVMKGLGLNKEKAFVPYIMAGDGGLERLGERLCFLQKLGATAIEVGIPFSDPVADGPIIQQAGLRALNGGTNLKSVMIELFKIRDSLNIPLIIMSYLNSILAYNIEDFIRDCEDARIVGLIIPDLPFEEEGIIQSHLEDTDIDLIRLVTLTTPVERIEQFGVEGGFLYCVTVKGITGKRKEFNEEVFDFLNKVKQRSSIPVLAGFGISDAEQAKLLSKYCDGVVVGSKIVEMFHKGDTEGIENLMSTIKKGDVYT
ncbi:MULTISPECIES: tryptophan synthase subunit alpha [unclassified Bacillus (in: firmicutes)]|uniref:tryptophan synthase subunit alpha n=1 Tax=unclassified Bacillus (in: firmicutes) TaxID=185979 RepID=UPI0008EB98E2|nr:MULTISPECIES: tryptophan synthase subunit alpha [unclassified Bacillus (in: firmicutes)]SFA91588.1 tryptophan synthase, alpha chain [Bacillus sp. UNCCL13]SFQ85606.1 tryptophan synthase, alpha chain [Bacillus sp. cl95]